MDSNLYRMSLPVREKVQNALGVNKMHTGYGYWPGEGMWIMPIIMPIIMLIVVIAVLYLLFGRGGWLRTPWNDISAHNNTTGNSETALEILKKRYARGEITQSEFEEMKKNILK